MVELKVIRKRFIAGAVCPQCQALDRIVVEIVVEQATEQEMNRRRCVACDFTDEPTAAERVASTGVPKGRPERSPQADAESVKVRILDPKDSL